MNLRQKFFVLALLPVALAMVAIALAVRHQGNELSRAQHDAVQTTSLANKRAELLHYVGLARNAIQPLYDGPDTPAAREAALAILARLEFGKDGYFFVYDLEGRSLMHPRQPELVGHNLWSLKDASGAPTIQRLIAAARAGGGYVQYPWEKPSLHQMAPKLGYVVALPRWNWMIGTGIYLDDVEATLRESDDRAQANIDRTLIWITLIASSCLAIVALCGLAVNISELKTADAKLRQLARQVVESQELERARISRELHDGISQLLVSVKLLLESASMRLPGSPAAASTALGVAIDRLNGTLGEVRRISQALRPAMLDDLGLAAAIDQLAREFGSHAGLPVEMQVEGDAPVLDDNIKTMLYRIAQEALTNIERHAHASRVSILLRFKPDGIHLSIADDGRGFDVTDVHHNPSHGIGLRNMRERLDAVGGVLGIQSWPGLTTINAWVPLTPAAAKAALRATSRP
ncbi:transmembrane sensor histidine kinase transcription regulator protein [Pandoraea eparura]|jgi:two-component system NarL family sensor kinase|uniref:Transmembrane sensor histidine kinase transcription regulator protein n=1 Tax=Pandoraea eparura TaxID=2508291 RepID=A0A5E4TNY2_9BURK|nr:cache domain-containing protein [Pandoraea eparura]VVD89525.1 transmembrane sensor histidine kinase transcription regulator protein [Pandoraea eparura]